MAGLDPAIHSSMAASEGGHDNKEVPNNFDTLQLVTKHALSPPTPLIF